jgi:hypothetical protein
MDKKIVDKGWAAMRQTLDREMPEKRRRRIVWWWLALLLLPVAGFGGWWWAEKNGLPKVPAPPNEPMAQRAEPSKVAPLSPPIDLPTTMTLDRERARLAVTKRTAASDSAAGKEKLSGEILRPSEPLASSASLNVELPSANASLSAAFPNSEASLAVFESFSALPILPQTVENQIEKSFSPWTLLLQGKSISVTKVKRKPWAFGVLAAVGTERFSAFNSLSLGGIADWKSGKKWGLRTGLAYNNYRSSEGTQIVALLNANDYVAAVNGAFEATDSSGNQVTEAYSSSVTPSSQVAVLVSALQRVEVSGLAFWQPTSKVRLYGGASLAYLVSLKSEANSYAGNYSLSLNGQSAEKAANALVSSEIRRWQSEAQVGLGWQVSKRFELGVFYRQPFSMSGTSAQSLRFDTNGVPQLDANAQGGVRATQRARAPRFNLQGVLFF